MTAPALDRPADDPSDTTHAVPSPCAVDDPGERHRLGVVGGLAALSLDALASVAYGPEAIVLVLALAGGAGLGLTVPVTIAIAVLLVVLTLSYRQVIAAFPQGGGAYGVARAHLGRRPGLLAAASLIVDYVLNVAVSVAAGVAALTSAFPALVPWTLELCLGVLVLVAVVNLRGIAESARWFIGPTIVYVAALVAVIGVGLLRSSPAAVLSAPADPVTLQTVGILLILRAFANGCAALTGVEAIANAVPSFKAPRVRRAQRTEVALGGLLALLLLGIAVLIEKFHIRPGGDATVLARVTAASLGDGWAFYVVQFATVVLLALAANTSYGGLPVLANLLARDNHLPHVFALRADRQVYRYGVVVLTVLSAGLLLAADGQVNALVPLFAIGVFVGFTLSQLGMVRHWWQARPAGWVAKAALNGLGGVLTGIAAVVVTATKFTEGAWVVVLVLPALMLLFGRIHRAYDRIGERLGLGELPPQPEVHERVVVVPVRGVDRLTARTLGAARSLATDVRAVHVCDPDDPDAATRLRVRWDEWDPGVPLVLLPGARDRRLAAPVLDYLDCLRRDLDPALLIGEVEPTHWWARVLQNQRGAVLARAVRHRQDTVVCRLRFPI